MKIKKLLGKKIKNLRQQRGMTQSKLAELIGISQRSLSGIETGENFLTSETLEKILECFDIKIDDLFRLEYLKPAEILTNEIIDKIKSVKDEEKIRTVYKIVNAIIQE